MKTKAQVEEQRIVKKYQYKSVDIRISSDDGKYWMGETALGFAVYGSLKYVCREITADIDYYKGESK